MGTVESHSWVKWAKRANWWTMIILMTVVASTNGQIAYLSTRFYNHYGLEIGEAVDGGWGAINCFAHSCATMQLIHNETEVAKVGCNSSFATLRLNLNENTKFGQYKCQANNDAIPRVDALNYVYRMCNNTQAAKCAPGEVCFVSGSSSSQGKCATTIGADFCEKQHKPVNDRGLCKGEGKGSEVSLCHGIAHGTAKDIVALEATHSACQKESPFVSYENVTAKFSGDIWITEPDPNITVTIPNGSNAENASVTCDLMCDGVRVPWGSEDVVDSAGSKVFGVNPSLFNRTNKCDLGCKVENKQNNYNASLWTKVYTIAKPKVTYEIIEFDLMIRVERNEGWPDGLEIKNCTFKSPSGKETNGLWTLSREAGKRKTRCSVWFPQNGTRRDTRDISRRDTGSKNEENRRRDSGSGADAGDDIKKDTHVDPEKKSPSNSGDQNRRSRPEEDDEDGIVTEEDDDTSSTGGNYDSDQDTGSSTGDDTKNENHFDHEKEPRSNPKQEARSDGDESGSDYNNTNGTSNSSNSEGDIDGDSGGENPNDESKDENNRQRRDSSSGGGSGSAHGREDEPSEITIEWEIDPPDPPKCYTYITGACLTEYQFWVCVKLTILAAVLYTLGFTLLALGCWYKRRLDNLWAHDDPDGPGKELAAIEAKCAKEKQRLEDVFDGIRKRRAEEGVTAQRAAEERAARMRDHNKPHDYDRRGKPSGGHKVHQSPSSSYGGSTPRYRTPSRSPSPHHRHQSPSREHRKPSQEREKPSRERSPSHGRRSHGKPKWGDRR